MADTRVAVIGIIVCDMSKTEQLNQILHEYQSYIVGRMGLPYPPKGMHIITIVIDAPHDTISALSGKLGMIQGVTSSTMYSD